MLEEPLKVDFLCVGLTSFRVSLIWMLLHLVGMCHLTCSSEAAGARMWRCTTRVVFIAIE